MVMEETGSLKIYFVHYPAAGHMFPISDIATLFASRGHHVTIITTSSNVPVLSKYIPSNPLLRLHPVEFPSQDAGLSDGIENLSSITDIAIARKVFQAIAMLQAPIEHFVEQHPPDCIIADVMFPWVHDLANKLRIPRLVFNSFSIFTMCAIRALSSANSLSSDSSDSLLIPSLPHPITINTTPPMDFMANMKSKLETQIKSHGVIINNFVELDGQEYIQHYEKTTGNKAWHLGPTYLMYTHEKAESGHQCLTWLDSKRDNSVLFICFGSLCKFKDRQLYEMACGIEASGHEFIWVVKEKKGMEHESEEEKEKWLPKGFEERNREKGMILTGWIPQVLILNHRAVGAFMTHCGWNSTVEGVSAGVPMVTWPINGDQFFNEKLITQVRGVGVEVGSVEWNSIWLAEKHKLVSRESIEKAVRRLLDDGDEALEIRRRAKVLGEKAKEAVRERGSSHNNLTALIDHLLQLRNTKLSG